MYGRRVAKHHPRVEAYGVVDEFNAALGVARAASGQDFVVTVLLELQRDLVAVMGGLATASEDRERYVKDGYADLGPEMLERVETRVREIEAQEISMKGWATPGATPGAAALDLARTVCRRAERRIWEMQSVGEAVEPRVLVYFNRVADLLWLLARWVETRETGPSTAS